MPEQKGLPVAGYKTTQKDEDIAFVNELKRIEERYNRWLDRALAKGSDYDIRSLSTARTQLQTATMWAARGVFQPQRIEGDLD